MATRKKQPDKTEEKEEGREEQHESRRGPISSWKPTGIGDLDSFTTALCIQIEENDEQLEKMALGFHQLGPERVGQLSRYLMNNKILTVIDLTCNDLGDRGCSRVFFALRLNKMLKELNVPGNEIGPGGCTAIAEFLTVNNTLQKLSLNANNFGDEGVAIIAKGLAKNKRLEFLNVRETGFTDIAAKELLQAVNLDNGNQFLHGLWWNFNNVSPDLMEKMNALLRKKHPVLHPSIYQPRGPPRS